MIFIIAIIIVLLFIVVSMYGDMINIATYSSIIGRGKHKKNKADIVNVFISHMVGATEETKKMAYDRLLEAYTKEEIHKPIPIFSMIPDRIPYRPKNGSIPGYSSHYGQRKLFLTELQFITYYIAPEEKAIIIYAGAAPNNKGGYLADLFPNVIWILVDPANFDVRTAKTGSKPELLWKRRLGDIDPEKELTVDAMKKHLAKAKTQFDEKIWKYNDNRIYVINDLFSSKLSDAMHDVFSRLFFISDIRTDSDEMSIPGSVDILWNDAQQYCWMRRLRAVQSMLKFRHPFYSEGDFVKEIADVAKNEPYLSDFKEAKEPYNGYAGIDFISNAMTKKLTYWSGEIYIQAWPGRSSTESRLVTDCSSLTEYDVAEYDDKYYYYNMIKRKFNLFDNPNADRHVGFDKCADCALENFIWEEYIRIYLDGEKSTLTTPLPPGDTYVFKGDTPLPRYNVITYVKELIRYARTPRFNSDSHGLSWTYNTLFDHDRIVDMATRQQKKKTRTLNNERDNNGIQYGYARQSMAG